MGLMLRTADDKTTSLRYWSIDPFSGLIWRNQHHFNNQCKWLASLQSPTSVLELVLFCPYSRVSSNLLRDKENAYVRTRKGWRKLCWCDAFLSKYIWWFRVRKRLKNKGQRRLKCVRYSDSDNTKTMVKGGLTARSTFSYTIYGRGLLFFFFIFQRLCVRQKWNIWELLTEDSHFTISSRVQRDVHISPCRLLRSTRLQIYAHINIWIHTALVCSSAMYI